MKFWRMKSRNCFSIGLLTILFLIIGPGAISKDFTEVNVAGIFHDHMVLQRNLRIPIWGWGPPGEKVTVQIKSITRSGLVDRNGRWEVFMPPFPASKEGLTIYINSENQHFEMSDVLFGDVWVCAGQSNMQFALKGAENGVDAIKKSEDFKLRLFFANGKMAWLPEENLTGEWKIAGPSTTGSFSAVGYFFGQSIRQNLDIPIGLIDLAAGGTTVEAWMGRKEIKQSDDPVITAVLDTIMILEQNYPGYTSSGFAQEWDRTYRRYFQSMGQFRRGELETKPDLPQFPDPRKVATYWFHGTVHPLQPFGIKGVLWYQGESNAHSIKQALVYENLFSYLIQIWRSAWGQGDFPFLFVQLPPFQNQDANAWIQLRESQARTTDAVANTAMVVTTDIYGADTGNIHPKQKKPIGERLARAALHLAYGKQIEYSAPKFRPSSVYKNGNTLSIAFSNLESGLVLHGDTLRGFEIAGIDNKYVPATGKIRCDRVEILSGGLNHPRKVRYNWKAWPDGNLFNIEGLPVAPFQFELPAQ